MQTLAELNEIFWAFWDTGNRWARVAIAIIFGWPLALFAYALLNPSIWAGSLMALIPFIALIMLIMTRLDPMVLAALALFKNGRTALRIISTIVGVELAIGVYCTLVKIGNDPELALLLILLLVTYIFLAMGVKGSKLIGLAKFACITGIMILTAIFIFGGRELAQQKFAESQRANAALRPSAAPAIAGCRNMVDGLCLPEGEIVGGGEPVPPRSLRLENEVKWSENGRHVEVRYNCAEPILLGKLKPGQVMRIAHKPYPSRKKDMCSFSADGKAFPVYGHREGKRIARFENSFPFPQDVPGQAVIAFIGTATKNPNELWIYSYTHYGYFPEEGGIIEVTHNAKAKEPVNVWLAFNYMTHLMNEQIGYNGAVMYASADIYDAVPSSSDDNF